jgi:PLP dependent protein
MDLQANLDAIRRQIAETCRRCGRDPASVGLVAVSKRQPAAAVLEAAAAGQRMFGENYVQELLAKQQEVPAALDWHFIGALQSNKVKYLQGKVGLIHSVDRLGLAEEISRQWGKAGGCAEILIEVHLGEEASKAGVAPGELEALVRRIAPLPHLRIRGLMALPPYLEDPEAVRPYFRRLRQLAEELNALNLPGVAMEELSMGMSHDFAVAIEEGATLVRVGTAIFGARS